RLELKKLITRIEKKLKRIKNRLSKIELNDANRAGVNNKKTKSVEIEEKAMFKLDMNPTENKCSEMKDHKTSKITIKKTMG
ncbi:30131_t:CDS:2, partial [Gigaspora margarita]